MEMQSEQNKLLLRAAVYVVITSCIAIIAKLSGVKWLVTLSMIITLIVLVAIALTLGILAWRDYSKRKNIGGFYKYQGIVRATNLAIIFGVVCFIVLLILFGFIYEL